MYIYHKNDEYKAFSSLRALCEYTHIPYDTLTYQFSRKCVERYYRGQITIVKTEAIASKRKKP